MKTLLFAIVFLLMAVISHSQIGAKTQQAKLYGKWENSSFGETMILMLNTDGTGELEGDPITFTISGNNLVMKSDGEINTYDFSLQGNSLRVSGGDLDQPITFTRGGASANQNAEAKTPAATSGGNDKLIGTWSNYGETIEFRSGGQCLYQSQTFPYSIQGNQIVLKTAQGNLVMPYTISGNQLTLTVNGQRLIYSKGKPSASAAQPAQANGNKKLDMSLVGKWCYVNVTSTNSGGTSTDECITINADGTYSYYGERSMSANTNAFSAGTSSQNGDSGTWWVAGDRIYYNAQKQGQGSYQLIKRNHPKNGDPMIVLDGTAYVTYFQKSPW
jgi:hypothetical protein